MAWANILTISMAAYNHRKGDSAYAEDNTNDPHWKLQFTDAGIPA